MNPPSTPVDSAAETLSALRKFARPRSQVERCELCSAELNECHQHLLHRQSRQIACSCDACAILFCGQENGQYLRVPRRVRQLQDFAFTDMQWEELMLPINLAFFVRNADGKIVASYPSPAGAIESVIELNTWDERIAGIPALAKMEAEVEALLVNRLPHQSAYFIVPLDECYRLVGLIRTKWRGLSGGSEVWSSIDAFFQDLQEKAGARAEVRHA